MQRAATAERVVKTSGDYAELADNVPNTSE